MVPLRLIISNQSVPDWRSWMAAHSNVVDWQSMYDASVGQVCTAKDNKTSKQTPIGRSSRPDHVANREEQSLRVAANALAVLWKTNRKR
jgi:hypothetical protein